MQISGWRCRHNAHGINGSVPTTTESGPTGVDAGCADFNDLILLVTENEFH